MGVRPYRSHVMRDHRHTTSSLQPGAGSSGGSVPGAFAAVGLLVLALVALSYPAVSAAALAGALTVPLARRASTAVDSFRDRRRSERAPGLGATHSARPK